MPGNMEESSVELTIYNMPGQVIKEHHFPGNKTEIDRGMMVPGIYYVKVVAGERQFMQKIVVE
jgi:hypothetical protein